MKACRPWHALHSNVRRSMPCPFIGSTSLIEVSPPHAGHSPRTPMGADWGACTLYPFVFGTLCASLESTSAARTSYDGASSVLERGRVDKSSLCNIDQFPTQKLRRGPGVLKPCGVNSRIQIRPPTLEQSRPLLNPPPHLSAARRATARRALESTRIETYRSDD